MPTPQNNPFGILMYHRIAPQISGVSDPTWNVTPTRFRRQMRGLLSLGYRPWPLRRMIEYHHAGRPIPARTFVVTFDDGYENVYLNAWPILKALSIPATVFVATAYLDADRSFPFDDWPAKDSAHVPVAAWKPLGISECVEMIEHGLVEIGSHAHTHADFRRRPAAFRDDLETSLRVLRERFGLDPVTFAFPYGFQGPELAAAVREAGTLCALTTQRALVTPRADPFTWGRIWAEGTDTPASLALKLRGWPTSFRDAWRWLRRPWDAARDGLGPRDGQLGRRASAEHKARTL